MSVYITFFNCCFKQIKISCWRLRRLMLLQCVLKPECPYLKVSSRRQFYSYLCQPQLQPPCLCLCHCLCPIYLWICPWVYQVCLRCQTWQWTLPWQVWLRQQWLLLSQIWVPWPLCPRCPHFLPLPTSPLQHPHLIWPVLRRWRGKWLNKLTALASRSLQRWDLFVNCYPSCSVNHRIYVHILGSVRFYLARNYLQLRWKVYIPLSESAIFFIILPK